LLEFPLNITAAEALAICRGDGLVVASHRELAGRPGSHHWHLRIPGRTGTLELNDWEGHAWVKVHPLREGTWVVEFAQELANRPG
jgi:hypothetical protein